MDLEYYEKSRKNYQTMKKALEGHIEHEILISSQKIREKYADELRGFVKKIAEIEGNIALLKMFGRIDITPQRLEES